MTSRFATKRRPIYAYLLPDSNPFKKSIGKKYLYFIHASFHSSEPTLAGVVAGSDSITSANLRAAFPSACNKRGAII